jgi:hypothetical protein
MTQFQTTVNFERGFGVPGEILLAGPTRARPGILNSAQAAYNIIGATYFTITTGATGANPNAPVIVAAGGTGPIAGILAAPKTYASFGTTAGGPLAATLTLPNNWNAEFLFMGEIVVTLPAAAGAGDLVTYNTTTGVIASIPALTTFTGVIAVTTGVLTVSAISAGGNLGIGSVITGTGVPGGTVITGLGSGTGGNGTYNTNIVTAVSSTTMSAGNTPVSGSALVPNAVVDRYTVSGAGLGVIRLTN